MRLLAWPRLLTADAVCKVVSAAKVETAVKVEDINLSSKRQALGSYRARQIRDLGSLRARQSMVLVFSLL